MPQVKLNANEALIAQKLFAECDGRAEGFRLGMEVAKSMILEQIVKQRKPEPKPDNLPEGV